jgi:hypothetical protein
MKAMSRSSKIEFRANMLEPIRLIGACVSFAAIGLFIIYWIASPEAKNLLDLKRPAD